jgi:hypothetical protein
MSTIIVGNTASVILDANYQTAGSYQPAGTYVTGVVGTSPISASGTTAITVTIDQAAITGATAATNAQVVRFLVKNTTGTTIPKGSAVYVSGATGDNALISLASATSDPSSSKTLGLTAEAIANDAFGYVIEAGYLTDIDTSATTAGAAVWLGNTPGSIVFVSPPAEPSHAVYLGVVVRVQAINGSILVKVQNGYELDELHDVFVGGVSTALPLVYNSTSSGWVAQALTSVGIADNAIVAEKISSGSVGSDALAANAVVAAKIAAAAVGTASLNSGAATNGQVLTADGSGAASFATLVAGMTISATTTTATVTSASSVIISLNTATGSNQATALPMFAHPTSHIIYQTVKTATGALEHIRKIDSNANTIMSSFPVTMTDNSEYIHNMVYGGSDKICAVTGGGGYSRWLIIDAGTGSQLASGNVINVGTSPSGYPLVGYDANAGQFTIMSDCTTAGAGRRVDRFIDASTYTTKVHTWNIGTIAHANASGTTSNFNGPFSGGSLPIWLSGPSRWALIHRYGTPSAATGQFIFISSSTATVDHLTITGKQAASDNSDYSAGNGSSNYCQPILSSTGTSICYTYSYGSSTSTRTVIFRIPISSISAAYNSTVATYPTGGAYIAGTTYGSITGAATMGYNNHFAAIGANGKMYLASGYNGFFDEDGTKVGANSWQVDSYSGQSANTGNYYKMVSMNTISGVSYGYFSYFVSGDFSVKKAKLRSVNQAEVIYSSSTATGLSLRAADTVGSATISVSATSSYTIGSSTLTTLLVSPGGTVSILISGGTSSVDGSIAIPTWVMR